MMLKIPSTNFIQNRKLTKKKRTIVKSTNTFFAPTLNILNRVDADKKTLRFRVSFIQLDFLKIKSIVTPMVLRHFGADHLY